MAIIRVIPLLGFLLFCAQIMLKYRKLKMAGIPVASTNSRVKTIVTSTFLLLFWLVFFTELLFQPLQVSISFFPQFMYATVHNSTLLKSIGATGIVLSEIGLFFTLNEFNKSLRFGLNADNIGELVTSGIFSYSRNPFFVSILFLFIGIALVFSSLFFVSVAALSTISIHFFILKEEHFMQKNYGDEYKEYCNKVRRYF